MRAKPTPEQAKQMDMVLNAVMECTGYKKADIINPRRFEKPTETRHIFCFLAATELRPAIPLHFIGGYIGRDHATVLNSVKRARVLAFAHKDYHKHIVDARQIIRNFFNNNK